MKGGEEEVDDEIKESGILKAILARPSPVPERQRARSRQKAESWTSILRVSITWPRYRPSRQQAGDGAHPSLALGWSRFPHQAQIIPV